MTTALVVGAGVVGLATAFALQREGCAVTVLDRDPEGDRASLGNAGGIAVTEVIPAAVPGVLWRVPKWLLDPLGPLAVRPRHAPHLLPWLHRFARSARPADVERIATALAALNRRVHDDLVPMLAAAGLSGELYRAGALTVYESEAGRARDDVAWTLRRRHGIVAEALAGPALREMEPALGERAACGVFTPQWSHVSDPARIVTGLQAALVGAGGRVRAGDVRRLVGDPAGVDLADGRRCAADVVVVAAGAWSAGLARSLGDRALLESERGYNATLPHAGVSLGREIIFAERSFVATPLRPGLRIGGAAEFGGLRAAPDHRRADALLTLAERFLPGLRRTGATRWAGHRPTTPDSLPVIGRSPRSPRVIYAFGHGHLGLTQAATTARLVADLVADRPPPIDLAPFSIARFARGG